MKKLLLLLLVFSFLLSSCSVIDNRVCSFFNDALEKIPASTPSNTEEDGDDDTVDDDTTNDDSNTNNDDNKGDTDDTTDNDSGTNDDGNGKNDGDDSNNSDDDSINDDAGKDDAGKDDDTGDPADGEETEALFNLKDVFLRFSYETNGIVFYGENKKILFCAGDPIKDDKECYLLIDFKDIGKIDELTIYNSNGIAIVDYYNIQSLKTKEFQICNILDLVDDSKSVFTIEGNGEYLFTAEFNYSLTHVCVPCEDVSIDLDNISIEENAQKSILTVVYTNETNLNLPFEITFNEGVPYGCQVTNGVFDYRGAGNNINLDNLQDLVDHPVTITCDKDNKSLTINAIKDSDWDEKGKQTIVTADQVNPYYGSFTFSQSEVVMHHTDDGFIFEHSETNNNLITSVKNTLYYRFTVPVYNPDLIKPFVGMRVSYDGETYKNTASLLINIHSICFDFPVAALEKALNDNDVIVELYLTNSEKEELNASFPKCSVTLKKGQL